MHDEDVVEDPILTPSTEESSQNVQEDVPPQVILSTPSQLPSLENNMNMILEPSPNIQFVTISQVIDYQIHML